MARLQGTKLADFDPINKVNELQIIDITVGDGDEVAADARITAHYTGAVPRRHDISE